MSYIKKYNLILIFCERNSALQGLMLLESIISSIFKSQFRISSIIFALVAINLNANIEFLPLHAEATLRLPPYIMISEDF